MKTATLDQYSNALKALQIGTENQIVVRRNNTIYTYNLVLKPKRGNPNDFDKEWREVSNRVATSSVLDFFPYEGSSFH